jgi:DHA1 family bicyclomycin/chloramphenicol resistance-like MFS transporter
MVRDLFPPQDAARVFSMLMLVMGVAPILAPLAGGYLLTWLGWSAIFWVQAAFGLAILLAVALKLPETHRRDASRSLAPSVILTVYGRLIAERRFLGCALAGGISIAGMFAYIAGSPFVFIQLHGLPADQYGWLFGANALGFIVMAQVNARVLRRWSADAVVRAAGLVQLGAGLLLLAAAATGIGGLAGLVVPLFVYIACIAFILPNTTALAMAPHGQIAGAASALLGMLQFGLAAVVATLVGAIHDGTAVPMAGLIALCSVLAPLCYRVLASSR